MQFRATHVISLYKVYISGYVYMYIHITCFFTECLYKYKPHKLYLYLHKQNMHSVTPPVMKPYCFSVYSMKNSAT